MKSYFTKFLKADGHFFYPGAFIRSNMTGATARINEPFPEHLDETEWDHMHLMLCSRDIHVGDKILFPQTKDDYKNNNFSIKGTVRLKGNYSSAVWLDDLQDELQLPNNYMLKIIGPISPEAKWAREGDEFNESDWMGYSTIMDKPLDKEFHKDISYNLIKILGPCGHFH